MSEVPEGGRPGQGSDPHTARAWEDDVARRLPAKDVVPLDFANPAEIRSWLRALTTQVEDLASAAEDATRPPGQRYLGRIAARAKVIEAHGAIAQIVQSAIVGLDRAGPSSSGGQPPR